jgi:UDP-GlcNAc:undecaprenyl-phosphate GlcNAc-1-phosphate transferase
MTLTTLLIFSGFLVGGISISLIINGLLLRFSKSLGIRNHQDFIIRWNSEAKPSLGGISFFISFLFAIILYAIVFGNVEIFRSVHLLGLFSAGCLAFLMGLADDAYNTRPFLKLLAQILCGLFIALTGTTIDFFDADFLNEIITVIWVVGVMNSINMLDNMDGISTSVCIFILATCAGANILIYGFSNSISLVLILSLLGTLIGFLFYNWHPSKLFMGDAGSQFIGFILAYFTIDPLWNSADHFQNHSGLGLLVTLVAFTPAASDTLTVFINRISRNQSPMKGGRDHTTHHLVYKGFSERKVLLTFFILSAVSCIFAISMVYFISQKNSLLVCLFSVFFFVTFCSLFYVTKKYKQPTND